VTLAKLVGGTNGEGYTISLDRAFDDILPDKTPPTKSALSQFRQSINFSFFEDQFSSIVVGWHQDRPKWKGLYFTAVDGDNVCLPCSDEVLEAGYYPVAYYSCATDVITGTPLAATFSNKNDEIGAASDLMMKCVDIESTVFVYDRLYLSKELLDLHSDNQSGHFIARCKLGGTFTEVSEFAESGLDKDLAIIEGQEVRLIRFRHENSSDDMIFASNLPRKFTSDDIGRLYSYRWGSETGNRDKTSTMQMEQFHSKSVNEILQEFYSVPTIQALSRIICARETKPEKDFMKMYNHQSLVPRRA
jgi:hypothetical protein